MSPKHEKKPHGQIRQSQVVTTFGPGAMLDLPNYSVLVAGLDHWQQGDEIHEPRLIAKLRHLLDLPNLRLYSPPPDREDPTAPPTGITAWQFPEWFITQDVEESDRLPSARSRLLVHRSGLVRGKFVDRDRRKHPVVPVRFVRACPRGHVGDLDWYGFVHQEKTRCRRQLWIDEKGTSADLTEVWVRCECGMSRRMSDAAQFEIHALGYCDGSRPWLGPHAREDCNEYNRLLVRTASNAYFPQIFTVISLPDRDEALVKAVDQAWEAYLQYVETIEDLRDDRRRKPPVQNALEGFTDEEVFAEIEGRRKGDGSRAARPVKQVEIETLLVARDEIGNDRPDGDFYARALPENHWKSSETEGLDRVVLVHRLREVVAQVGFTRFESATPDIQGELELGVRRADLAQEVTWLPAVENRGEGVFVAFDRDSIEEWRSRPEVQRRGEQLVAGFDLWQRDHPNSRREFFGLEYVMIHSLSHLLITAVSLECGYPASSIRERIYATDSGYGLLLYTGSPDAEGTLGGLVEIGRRIADHLRTALELGRLCSNDPVCAQHNPGNTHERRFLHGAACHGCLLIAETCCEQHNDFLDRALVVPTLDNLGAEFFRTK